MPAAPESNLSEAVGFDAGRAGFSIRINDEIDAEYRYFATMVMPGGQVHLSSPSPVTYLADHGLERLSDRETVWQAPDEPGHHLINIRDLNGNTIQLNVFVLRPAAEVENGALRGYAIGQYPSEPYRGEDVYLPPEGFIEVPPDLRDLPVSPHFTLGQFLCKQAGGPIRYAVVQERLLVKLERLLEAVNAHGWHTDGFVVMSGYRTPAYNAGIGNGRYSRHVYGGAADIYIDEDGNGIMDDLNADGVHDRRDAAVLFDFIDGLLQQPDWDHLHGGLGEYGSTSAHGPFVHVDERGWNARWGRS